MENFKKNFSGPGMNLLGGLQRQVDATLDTLAVMFPDTEQSTSQARQTIQNTLQTLRNDLQQMASSQPNAPQMPMLDDMSTRPRNGMITRSDMDQNSPGNSA